MHTCVYTNCPQNPTGMKINETAAQCLSLISVSSKSIKLLGI